MAMKSADRAKAYEGNFPERKGIHIKELSVHFPQYLNSAIYAINDEETRVKLTRGVPAMDGTLKKNTLTRMTNVRKMTESFAENCQDSSKAVMKDHDISCSELALNFGHYSIFAGLVSPKSAKELLNACYTAFFKLFQNLTVLNGDRVSFLLDECLGLVNTFHQDHVNRGYSLPALSEENMEVELDSLMQTFVNKDPLFVDMFHGNPPKSLLNAARNYELSSEIQLSLDDLVEFLFNNKE